MQQNNSEDTMKQSESDVQAAIIEALIFDGWMILRINQGGRHGNPKCPTCGCRTWQCFECGTPGVAGRYTRFAYWQALGIDKQDSGISDVIAVKANRQALNYPVVGGDIVMPNLLAIECKAPDTEKRRGRKMFIQEALASVYREESRAFASLSKREQNQARFLWEIQDHGGISIVADDLSDIQPYLDRVTSQ